MVLDIILDMRSPMVASIIWYYYILYDTQPDMLGMALHLYKSHPHGHIAAEIFIRIKT